MIHFVPVEQIEGKVYVIHASEPDLDLDDWVSHNDHFYVKRRSDKTQPLHADLKPLRYSDFEYCSRCYEARMDEVDDLLRFSEAHEKLTGLDLFAGAGGLSAGLEQSGFVDTKWAIEWSTSAAYTYA